MFLVLVKKWGGGRQLSGTFIAPGREITVPLCWSGTGEWGQGEWGKAELSNDE